VKPAAPRLREHLGRLFPDHRVVAIDPLGPDTSGGDTATAKAAGYGMPVKVVLEGSDGARRELVWRVAGANEFGHDRRADRAAETLLAFDDFPRIPGHVRALDAGAVRASGELVSLRDYTELYLITSYARGTLYADDLRRIARTGATARDVVRVDALARYLAELHVPVIAPPAYRRAIRDLVGSGEGIYGMVDGYPANVPGAPPERLAAIERKCAAWRWRLREHDGRLCRTHGDFHPFNVLFGDDDRVAVLDASRGTCGDPADDVTAMAINFLLFALDAPGGWGHLGPLWHRFWTSYAHERSDPSLLQVAPPFFAWRALVVCNPRFYPSLAEAGRDTLLHLAERALAAHRLEPAWADEALG